MKKDDAHQKLIEDPKINNRDIPVLIARAEELYQQAQKKHSSISAQDLTEIANEVSIPDHYIQQAISEYQVPKHDRQNLSTSHLKKEWLIIGALIVLVMVLLLKPQPSVQINNNITVSSIADEKPASSLSTDKKNQSAITSITSSSPEITAPPPSSESLSSAKIDGRWYLVSYIAKDDEQWFNAPIAKTPIELRENWRFTDSRFRRVIDPSLSFSGEFTFEKPLDIFAKQINGEQYLLVGQNVRSTIPTIQRKRDYYHIEVTDTQLLIFYIGTKKNPTTMPPQGHLFEREP